MARKSTPCYCLKIRRAANDVTRFYNKMVEPSGVMVSQYSLLLNIEKLDKGSIRELSDLVELDRSTLARNLKPLLSKKFIQDSRITGTRDCKLVLTPKGKEVLEQAKLLWVQAQQLLAACRAEF